MSNYLNICNAIRIGDLEKVKRTWSENINIDFQNNNCNSLIMIASKYNQKKIINYLLKFSPNLYLWNNQEETVFSIAEQLDNKEIFKILINDCWKQEEKMFLFEYHVKPKFTTELLGAYVNCWVIDEEFNHAKVKGQNLVQEEDWEIISIEDISEIKRGDIREHDEKFKYYQQTMIDKDVLVFYTYDSLEED
jgi:hypothetical protein